MDKNKLEERRRKKREEILASFGTYKTMNEIAREKGMTKQAIQHLFKKYGVIKEWKEHAHQVKGFEGSCVYSIYFLKEPWKKYYGSTTNFRRRVNEHVWDLSNHKHGNKYLQMDFDKHGREDLKFEVVKKVPEEQLLQEEKNLIDADPICYNEKSIVLDLMAYETSRYEKSRLLPTRKSKYKFLTWSRPAQMWKPQPYTHKYKKAEKHFLGYFKDEEKAKEAVENFFRERGLDCPSLIK
jgi:hypothetical protein